MKDYRQLIEEKYTQIMLISGNSKEIIDTLNDLVKTNNLDLVRLLPFCDFLIELLIECDILNNEDIFKYYEIYSICAAMVVEDTYCGGIAEVNIVPNQDVK